MPSQPLSDKVHVPSADDDATSLPLLSVGTRAHAGRALAALLHRLADWEAGQVGLRRLVSRVRTWVAHVPVWLHTYTFLPAWLPPRWRHPLTGYGVAALVEALAVLLTIGLRVAIPDFPFPTALPLLGVMTVALMFGIGPSLAAALLGMLLLEFAVLPPQWSWQLDRMEDAFSLGVLTVVGSVMSVAASRTEQARREAVAATQARDTFLSLAAHELRTPMTAYMGIVELARWRTQRLAATAHAYSVDLATDADAIAALLTQADAAVTRQNRLIAELLDVSRIQVGTLTYAFAPCDLAAIVRDAVVEQQQLHPDRTLRLALPTGPMQVVGDGERLRQVVTNFVTNALKFAPAHQPIDVTPSVEADRARVTVHDRGPGLTPEQQRQAWEQYHRVPGVEVVSGSDNGLGLGLHLCRTIVLAHPGGQVGVDSEVGKGSAFWFTLPSSATLPAED